MPQVSLLDLFVGYIFPFEINSVLFGLRALILSPLDKYMFVVDGGWWLSDKNLIHISHPIFCHSYMQVGGTI